MNIETYSYILAAWFNELGKELPDDPEKWLGIYLSLNPYHYKSTELTFNKLKYELRTLLFKDYWNNWCDFDYWYNDRDIDYFELICLYKKKGYLTDECFTDKDILKEEIQQRFIRCELRKAINLEFIPNLMKSLCHKINSIKYKYKYKKNKIINTILKNKIPKFLDLEVKSYLSVGSFAL